jgi:hypothetical protein
LRSLSGSVAQIATDSLHDFQMLGSRPINLLEAVMPA